MAFGFLKKALKACGKVVGAPIKLAGKGATALGNVAGKVPVIGKGLKGVITISTGPIHISADVAKGTRLDKVALNHLNREVGAIKDVAPYAQMVISLVPGVGTAISAGLSASLALAQGQPITKAFVEGIKGALPGGPIAKAAFSVTEAAVNGKSIDEVALSAVPLPPEQKKALQVAVSSVKDIAAGKKVDLSMATRAFDALPADVRKAINISSAVTQAQKIQKAAPKAVNPDALKVLAKEGAALANANPVLKTGAKVIKDAKERQGFILGTGLLARKGVTPLQMTAIRARISPVQQRGFDMALALKVGMVDTNGNKRLKTLTAEQKFGFAVAAGVKDATPQLRAPLLKEVATVPEVKQGAIIAIDTVVKKPFWKRALNAIGITRFGAEDDNRDYSFSYEFEVS